MRKAAERLLFLRMKQHAIQQHGKDSSSSTIKFNGQSITDTLNQVRSTSSNSLGAGEESSARGALGEVEWEDEELQDAATAKHLAESSDSDEEEGEKWNIPITEQLDVSVLSSLPSSMKQSVIEDMLRRERLQRRQTYIPIAGDATLYSQTQLSNFLKSRRVFEAVCKHDSIHSITLSTLSTQ